MLMLVPNNGAIVSHPGALSHVTGVSKLKPDPYQPPLTDGKLSDSDASDVKRRDIAIFVLLNLVTCGVYWFYVTYAWAKELNGLQGRAKYSPLAVLLLNIVTCSIAGTIFECLFAFDLDKVAEARGTPSRLGNLAVWVVVLNVIAFSSAAFTAGVGMIAGLLASVMLQVELNRVAEQYS